MPNISYVYPSMMQPRGTFRNGLMNRWEIAKPLGCSYVEIPANFIKNPYEAKVTGLQIQDFLTPEAVEQLYLNEPKPDPDVKYIFHTDPSFDFEMKNGTIYPAARLKWNENDWVDAFTAMLVTISEHLGKPADKIEIHPGDEKYVSYKDTALAMKRIRENYGDAFGTEPDIILENRNRSNISNGSDLRNFWIAMEEYVPEICDTSGIVLDISVLFNVARRERKDIRNYLDAVPNEGIKGIHVHAWHDAAQPDDPIPWEYAFEKIKPIDRDLFINPEIHFEEKVESSIGFCNQMLRY